MIPRASSIFIGVVNLIFKILNNYRADSSFKDILKFEKLSTLLLMRVCQVRDLHGPVHSLCDKTVLVFAIIVKKLPLCVLYVSYNYFLMWYSAGLSH